MRHRPTVAPGWPRGGEKKFRSTCGCGWRSRWEDVRGRARAAQETHLAGVAPDAADRCRDTKTHRTRWWDPCPVCAGQGVIPGFEDLGATG